MWLRKVKLNSTPKGVTLLVRGWGEGRKHYVYRLAKLKKITSGYRWVEPSFDWELSFTPHEYAELEQPAN